MSNQAITAAVSQLKQEHIRLCKELERVDQALSVLGSLDGIGAAKPGRKAKLVVTAPKKGKRKISAAARKKMSEAARARWAAAKKEKTPAK
jgi:hypothetical protein